MSASKGLDWDTGYGTMGGGMIPDNVAFTEHTRTSHVARGSSAYLASKLSVRRSSMRPRTLPLVALALALPVVAAAQAPAPVHDHSLPMADGAPLPSELAKEQMAAVEASVAEFASLESAWGAGFRPVLGMIPTMGTHWVSPLRMLVGSGEDVGQPEHLMFSPMDGEQRLVGAAFAYQAIPDEEQPDLFDGALDGWHTHPELSPPGRVLTMLHVWFVPSPDGPFAGHNPWLPFWAVGLEPPDASRLADAEDDYRIRALALALSETVESGEGGGRRGSILRRGRAPGLEDRRDGIREVIPELERAQREGDLTAWNAAADVAVAEWEELRAAYLDAVRNPELKARLSAFYDEMLGGGHAH